LETSLPPAQRNNWYDANSEILGDVPDSSHDIEIVGPVTVAPATGDVNLTSAKTKAASIVNSQANRRIMVVVL
jgi:hypothetical protein